MSATDFKIPEPPADNRLIHRLWHILGGEDIDMVTARIELSETTGTFLEDILTQTREPPPSSYVFEKQWLLRLNSYHPDTWTKHGAAFRQALWHCAVGEFCRDTRTENGDEIADLIPDIKTRTLKNAKVLEAIEAGRHREDDHYFAAIIEITRLYAIDIEDTEKLEAVRADKLMDGPSLKRFEL